MGGGTGAASAASAVGTLRPHQALSEARSGALRAVWGLFTLAQRTLDGPLRAATLASAMLSVMLAIKLFTMGQTIRRTSASRTPSCCAASAKPNLNAGSDGACATFGIPLKRG